MCENDNEQLMKYPVIMTPVVDHMMCVSRGGIGSNLYGYLVLP